MIASRSSNALATVEPEARARDGGLRTELYVFALLLLVVNLPLLGGHRNTGLAFQMDAVAAGEWWRVLTHPFVHGSWYHLFLDGAAFLALYGSLSTTQRWQRLGYLAASAAGSLLVALGTSPLIASHGLCGLSGAAHGLMAVAALEILMLPGPNRSTRIVALASLIAITLKCAWELATGHAFFSVLHFGMLGTPIVACHAGGLIGGLIAAFFAMHNASRPSLPVVKG